MEAPKCVVKLYPVYQVSFKKLSSVLYCAKTAEGISHKEGCISIFRICVRSYPGSKSIGRRRTADGIYLRG